MTFSTDPFSTAPLRTHSSDDDRAFRARCRALGDRILDGVAETLDELARERDRPAALRALIAQRVRAHTAPLLCSQATCRRAKACRRKRCRV